MKPKRLVMLIVSGLLILNSSCERRSLSAPTDLETELKKIGNEVVDFTSVQEPLVNDRFAQLRDGMTLDVGEKLAKLLAEGSLGDRESELAILALTGLGETDYWALTTNLLSSSLSERQKELILCPHYYGPGYASAYRHLDTSNMLANLKPPFLPNNLSNVLGGIMSGSAERHWREVLDDPDAFGWKPDFLRRFQSK